MAVTLPTFADVGIVDPRSVGTQPTYPANDAVAEAEGTLGKGIEKAGGAIEDYAADAQRKKAKLEQANATTDLFIRLTPLHEQIKHETDPAKLAELRTQFDQLLPTSGTGISDPYARKLWEATHAKAIFQAKADADSRNTVLDRNRADAEVLGRVDQAVRVGAAADDPQAFENAKLTIKNNLDYYQQYGNLSPTQRYELNKKAQTDLVEGRALALVNRGRVDEASALLEQNRTDLGAARAGNLEHKIEQRGSAIRVAGVANGLIGGGPAATSGRHINYGATGALGDPTQPGWEQQNLTNVSAPGGASFKVNKAAASDFAGFLKDLEAAGYKINPGESGGHNLREMRDGDQLSEHAYGTAIDINSSKNPYSKSGEKVTDLPANVAELAAKHNLEWGGNWTSPVDPMHFQWRGPGGKAATATADAGAPDQVDNWETRNNNFGGIRKAGVNATAAEGGFQSFPTPEAGVQAISNNLDRYAAGGVVTATNPDGKPLNTIRGIVSTWAPPNENKTDDLIARASQVTGYGPDQQLNVSDPAVKAKLIEATIRNEQGGKLPVSPAVIAKVAGGGVPTQQNRTGLPLPSEVTAQIMSDPRLRNDQERYQVLQRYETQYRAQEAALAQQERIADQQQKQVVQNRTNEYYADVYSANPKLTPSMAAVDPAFNSNPDRRKAMIELINNPPGSGVPAAQSYNAAQSLIDRIRLPYGDPNKITTPDEIWANHRLMNKPDVEFALKTLNDSLSPGREKFNAREKAFLDGVKPEIDRSGMLPSLPNDGKGRVKFYEFQHALDSKIDTYLKAGKDPSDLLDPSKPDYMGKPETLKPYKRSITEALADFENEMGGGEGATNAFGPASSVDLSKIGSFEDMKAAVKKDPSLRDRAIGISIQKGWIAPPAAPQPVITPPIAPAPSSQMQP